jgi:hypothetical protein
MICVLARREDRVRRDCVKKRAPLKEVATTRVDEGMIVMPSCAQGACRRG